MGEGWDRVESMIHAVDLADGLAARIPDPMWMLARQRQIGEFHGDDAAQPIAIRIVGRSAKLVSYRAGGATPVPLPDGSPLEAVVETTPGPTFGSAGAHATARAGRRLARLLADEPAAIDALRRAFPVAVADDLGEATAPAARVIANWALDGRAVAAASPERLETALGGLDAPTRATVVAAIATWRQWLARNAPIGPGAWDDEHLRYRFSVAAAIDDAEVVLAAPDHDGGDLDWFACDVAARTQSHGLKPRPTTPVAVTALPTPVRFQGMPASRWWEYEDSAVSLAQISAGPADVARMALVEFAAVYGADWFLVPVPLPVGTITDISEVKVIDTFGGRTPVPSAMWKAGRPAGWQLFTMRGDRATPGHEAPWLYLAPACATSLDGPAQERVTLTRDEAGNLAWGVEHLIEGPLGDAISRHSSWRLPLTAPASAVAPQAGGPKEDGPKDGGAKDGETSDEDTWRYRLGGEAPPWWIPLQPEQIAVGSAQVRFRRSRLESWALLGAPDQIGPRSQFLDPGRPRWIAEHEVPANGVAVERAYQLARGQDGSLHLWLARRRRPAEPGRGSGLRYDLAD